MYSSRKQSHVQKRIDANDVQLYDKKFYNFQQSEVRSQEKQNVLDSIAEKLAYRNNYSILRGPKYQTSNAQGFLKKIQKKMEAKNFVSGHWVETP